MSLSGEYSASKIGPTVAITCTDSQNTLIKLVNVTSDGSFKKAAFALRFSAADAYVKQGPSSQAAIAATTGLLIIKQSDVWRIDVESDVENHIMVFVTGGTDAVANLTLMSSVSTDTDLVPALVSSV